MRAARVLVRLSAPAVVATLALFAAPAAQAQAPGLVGAYGFEEPSGTTAADTSGAGNAGAIAGATRSATGRFGAALSFDGIDDRVNVNDANSLDLSPAMTLSAWVRPTANDWRTVLIKERPGGLAYALYSSTDTNRPSAEVAAPGMYEARGTATLASNTWSHLTSTYDGATLRLFVNGTQVATRAGSGSITVSSGALRIGGNAVWGEYFRGLIDEVRVYNRALSATEIQADMNAPVVNADAVAPSKPAAPTANRNGDDITLSWPASTDNVGVTGYRIFRDGTQIGTTSGTLTFLDADRPYGAYVYRIYAVDAAGNVSAPSDATNVTVPDMVAPSTPTGVTLSKSGKQVTISWNPASDNVGVTGYRIHRATEAGFTPTEANRVATPTVMPYVDTVPSSGFYKYRVVAVDLAGNATASTEAAITVTDGQPPIVTNITATTVGNEIHLEWDQPAHTGPMDRWEIHRTTEGPTDPWFNPTPANRIGTTTTESFVDTAPPASGPIHYKIVGIDVYGVQSDGGLISTGLAADTTPPTVGFGILAPCPTIPVQDFIDFVVTAEDNRTGVSTELLLDGERVHSDPDGFLHWGVYTTTLANGPHVVTAVARDMAGNEATAVCNLNVDNPARTIDIMAPAAAATVSGVVPITVEVRRNGAIEAVDGHVTVRVDGVSIGNFWERTRNWDTRSLPNGTHTILVELRPTSGSGPAVDSETITVEVDNTPPVVTGVSASGVGDDVTVSWEASAGAANYRVFRDGSLVTTTSALSFLDADRPIGTYAYTVVAVDAVGNASDPSDPASVTVSDVTPPSAPGRPTMSLSATSFDVQVSWAAATDNVGVTGYQLHRSTTSGFTPSAANRIATVTDTTYTDTAPSAEFFYYAVVAVDAAGNVSAASPDRGIRVTGPPVPNVTNVTATPVGSSIQLNWDQPAFPSPLAPYRIYRSTTGSGFTQIGTSTDRTFTDPTPPITGTIYYRIVTYSAAGTFSDGTTIQTSPVPDTTPPTVTITQGCNYGTIHDYVPIYASVTDDRPGVPTREILIDGEPAHMPQGADWESKTVSNGPHVLSVVARDAAGNEGTASCDIVVHNPLVTADFAAPADGATVHGVVTLQLDPRADGVPLTGGDMTWLGVTISPTGSASGSGVQKTRTWDTTTVPNGVYTLRLDVGWMDYSNPRATKTITVTVDNTVPAVTGVTAQAEGNDARVSWDAAPPDAGVTGYRVHRGTSAGFTPSDGNRVGTPTGATFTDAGLAPGTYFYKVVAVGDGISEASAAAEVTIAPDTTAPTVSLINAACNGHTVFDYVDPLRATASDDRGGPVTLEVFVGADRIRGPVTIPAGSSPYQFQWNTRAHADGEHTMKLVARDGAGNEGTYDCLWTIDNKELTIPIVVSSSPLSGTTTIRFQPKADGVDVTTPVAVSIDGNAVFSRGSGPYEYTWDTTTAANGPHTIEAKMFWAPYNSPLVTSTKEVTVQNTAPVPTGLVAAYGFEETSATTVTDSSPSGSTGTISGATRSTAGRFGSALSFDGINDLVNVPDANSLDLTTGMTLSAWVRPTALGDWRTVVMKNRPGGLAYALYAHTDTNRPAGIVQTNAEQDARGGTSQLPMDTWTHLATTYDGTSVKLYIDGTLAATRAATGSIVLSTGALQIGGNSIWTEWFKGLIDEVRVYSRALSATEIAADRDRPVVPAG